jgi:hypothetical protein
MTVRIDPKSLLIGVALAGLLVLVVGVVSEHTRPQVGRFRLACTSTHAHLVDTMTGQVWSSERGYTRFAEPKFALKPVAAPAGAKSFVGRWVSADPDHSGIAVSLDADGSCTATDNGDAHIGSWRAEGGRVFITVDDETVTGQIDADGRLVLWEEGDEADGIAFTRVR